MKTREPDDRERLHAVMAPRRAGRGSAFHDDEHATRLLRLVLLAPAAQRREHLADLLRTISANLARGEPLPGIVSGWLADVLALIADLEQSPDEAFGLAPRRGRKQEDGRIFERIAHMHALVTLGAVQERAAGLVCDHFGLQSTADVIKAYNAFLRRWCLSLSQSGGERAELDGVRSGAQLVVEASATPASFPSMAAYIEAEFMRHALNSGLFARMV